MGLKDDEVNSEMRKMVSFITQEAMEKSREIRVKADEEFNIEKAKLVRSEAVIIESMFAKKIKQSSVQRKIIQSSHVNKARLRVLLYQEELLLETFKMAEERLSSVSQNQQTYEALLEKFVLQCALLLMDDTVTLRCRSQDVPLVSKCLSSVQDQFFQMTNKPVVLNVDESYPLPDSCHGGVIATALNGRITCDNTLKKRLELLCESMLPELRIMLFGVSKNRKFFD